MNLLQHQTNCLNKLSKYKVGALFMDAGSGKTRTTVEIINKTDTDFILYIAPYRGLNTDNYKESIQFQVDLSGGFKSKVIYVGIETIQSSDRVYLNVFNEIQKHKQPTIVLDESLKIKNQEAKRTKRILTLSNYATYKLILNGTPISRNYLDLKTQFDFLDRRIFNMSDPEFKNNFVEYTEITIRKGNSTRKNEYIKKYHNLDVLYKLIDPFVFTHDLKLDKNLQIINVNYKIEESEKEEHNKILNEVLSDEWLMSKPNFFLELTQKLQNNYSRSKEKFKIVDKLIDKKTVIVAKFIETQNELKKRYPNNRVLSWQKDAQCLNLQEYNKMILFDKHWDYGLFDQILKRIYRTGQKEDCIVYNLTGDVGLEQLINENIEKKNELLINLKQIIKDGKEI